MAAQTRYKAILVKATDTLKLIETYPQGFVKQWDIAVQNDSSTSEASRVTTLTAAIDSAVTTAQTAD